MKKKMRNKVVSNFLSSRLSAFKILCKNYKTHEQLKSHIPLRLISLTTNANSLLISPVTELFSLALRIR